MQNDDEKTNQRIKKLTTEIAAIKKDVYDLKKIILNVKMAESNQSEQQDMGKIEAEIKSL